MCVDAQQHIRRCPSSERLYITDGGSALKHVGCPAVPRAVQVQIGRKIQFLADVLKISGEIGRIDRRSVFACEYEICRIFPSGNGVPLMLLALLDFLEQHPDVCWDRDRPDRPFCLCVISFQFWDAGFHDERLRDFNVVFPSMHMIPVQAKYFTSPAAGEKI